MGVVKVIKVARKPGTHNAIRVWFSEPVNSTALVPSNYSVVGLGSPTYCSFVDGPTVVDLHYGVELPVNSNTVACWDFNASDLAYNGPVVDVSQIQRTGGVTITVSTPPTGRYWLRVGDWISFAGSSYGGGLEFNPGVFQVVTTAHQSQFTYNDPGAVNGIGLGSNVYTYAGIEDISGNDYHLGDGMQDGFVGSGIVKRSRRMAGLGGGWRSHELGPRTRLLGDLTVDAAVVWEPTPSGSATQIIAGYDTFSNIGGSTNNRLFRLVLNSATGALAFNWQHSSAAIVGLTDSVSQVILPPRTPCLITAVRRQVGSQYNAELYINGQLRQIYPSFNAPDGGTDASMGFIVGRGGFSVGIPTVNVFEGLIDSVRVSDTAYGPDDIRTYALEYIATMYPNETIELTVTNVEDVATTTPITGPNGEMESTVFDGQVIERQPMPHYIPNVLNVVPPVVVRNNTRPQIGNFSPSPGSNITADTYLQFDVTDYEDNINRIVLVVEFPAAKIREVAFDGLGFGPMYTDPSNTVTPIAGGLRFTLLRTGGWIQNDGPVITPFAIDLEGLENA